VLEALAAAGDATVAAISYNCPDAAGELWIIKGGVKVATHKLPATPAFEGLAVANGRAYVTTRDGSMICFGRK